MQDDRGKPTIRFVGSGVEISGLEGIELASGKISGIKISGVEVVTIPLTDYAALLDCRRKLQETELTVEQFLSGRKSVIDRNPEVAVYLAQNFGLMPMKDLLRVCRRKFGRQCTPSRSAAYRYWKTVRLKSSKRP